MPRRFSGERYILLLALSALDLQRPEPVQSGQHRTTKRTTLWSIPAFQVLLFELGGAVCGTIAAALKLSDLEHRDVPSDAALGVFYFLSYMLGFLGIVHAQSILVASAVPPTLQLSDALLKDRTAKVLAGYSFLGPLLGLGNLSFVLVAAWASTQPLSEQATIADALYVACSVIHAMSSTFVFWVLVFFFHAHVLRTLDAAIRSVPAPAQHAPQPAPRSSSSHAPAVVNPILSVRNRIVSIRRNGTPTAAMLMLMTLSPLLWPPDQRRKAVPYYSCLLQLMGALAVRNYSFNYRPPPRSVPTVTATNVVVTVQPITAPATSIEAISEHKSYAGSHE